MANSLLWVGVLCGCWLLACASDGTKLSQADKETLGPEIVAIYKQAKSGDHAAGVALGRVLQHEGQSAKARAWYRRGAEAGHVESQVALGRSYLDLVGERRSVVEEFGRRLKVHVEACHWLNEAAEAGHPDAQYLIAIGWSARACRRTTLGDRALHGDDPSDARREARWSEGWLRRATQHGHLAAEYQLADLLMQPFWAPRKDVWTEAERVTRIREGTDRLIEVARKGFAPAQYRLGVLHMPGYYCRRGGLPPTLACRIVRERAQASTAKSLFWYKRAAGQGHACAHTAIGSLFETGRGVKRSLARAHRHYEAASRLEGATWQGLAAPYLTVEQDTHESCRRASLTKLVEFKNRSDPSIVKDVQNQLAALGLDPGRIDGSAGRKTVAAVRGFQESAGLYPDGRIDFGLLHQLNRAVEARRTGRIRDGAARLASKPGAAAQPAPPAAPSPSNATDADAPGHRLRQIQSLYDRRVAAVIGVDRYRSWPQLEGARRDARRVAKALRAQGFDEVIEIYDEDATRRRILTLLGTELAARTDEDSLALIYFAGHGQTETLPNEQKRGYIIPVDADRRNAFATAISMDTLRDLSNRLPAKHVFYAMDSCYSGLGLTRGISRGRGAGAVSDFIRKLTGRRAVQMLTAGSEGERAIESGGVGLFTTHFLEAIAGSADLDRDGFVTASEIGAYVRPQVSRASRNRQTPQFGTLEGSGEVVFLPQ